MIDLAVNEGRLTEANAALAASMINVGAAEKGAASGARGLGAAFKGLGAAIKAHPYIALAAALVAVAVAAARISKAMKEARREAFQRSIDTGTKAAEENKTLRELYEAYKEADAKYQSDGSNKAAYVEATNNLIDALGAEGTAVRNLADDYFNLSDAMDEAVRKKRLENIFKEIDGINSARKQLDEAYGSKQTQRWGNGGAGDRGGIGEYWITSDSAQAELKPGIAAKYDYDAIKSSTLWQNNSEYAALQAVKNALDDYYSASSRQQGIRAGSIFEQEKFAFTGSAEKAYNDALKAIQVLQDGVQEGKWTSKEMMDFGIYQYSTYIRDLLEPEVGAINESISQANKDIIELQFDDLVSQSKERLPKTLDAFKEFRKKLIDNTINQGLFEGEESDIAPAVDAYLNGISGFENFYGIPRFKEEIKSLSSDTIKYLKNGGEATEEMRGELEDFLDVNGYSADQFARMFSEIAGSIDESGNVLEQTTSSQINNLTSLRDELSATTEALEAYKKAMEGGEKGDAAAEMAKVWKSATDSYKAGKIDTNEMRAAADLFFSRDFLAKNNMDLAAVGEALSSGIWQAVFSSDDYAQNFVDYLQQNSSELGDAIKITTDAAGNVQFAYKSISSLAEATGMSESAVAALLDALDVLGMQAMMSGEDMGKLVDELGLIPGQTVKSADGIREIIQTLADDGLDYWDIQGTLKSLESAGMIDTSGFQDLGNWINEATANLENVDNADANPTVEVTDNATSILNNVKQLLGEINGTNATATVSVVLATVGGAIDGAVAGISNWLSGTFSGFSSASGTTNAHGGKTYINELGPETVIQDGVAKEFNDGKPALVDLNPGDIVLPADVTADAKKNGHKVKTFGSAVSGIGKSNIIVVEDNGSKKTVIDTPQDAVVVTKSNSGSGGGTGSGGKSKDKRSGKEKVDWIEVALDRIERKIASLSKIAESSFKKLSTRLSATKDEISSVTDEIEKQKEGYARYLEEAESVELDEDLKELVRNGTIDITGYNKKTKELIEEYKSWYEKALDCSEAVDELHDKLASLYEARFEYAQQDFDNQLGIIEHRIEMYEKTLDAHEAKGYMASAEYYSALADVQRSNISMLQKELADLTRYFNEAMDSGEIEEYSDAWYSMKSSILDVEAALADANQELIEYANAMRETQWAYFDYARDQIANLTEEADFLIDLMSNGQLFDENGKYNEKGMATIGLHAQNFDTYMAQADAYFAEMKRIEEQIANDPYNTTLIQRREELLGLQQSSIQSAEAEKQAVKQLAEEGFGKELEALKKLIDAYEDSLDSAKDLYEYQKLISDKTANIASIQKQLAAYANDSSEENRARVQKLQDSLKKAQDDLQEAEYNQYIKDQKELLSGLYDDYEEMLNARLDDIEGLFSDMIKLSNEHASEINQTLLEISENVGYRLSSGVDQVWADSESNIVGEYRDDFTMVNYYLDRIEAYVANMSSANGLALSSAVKEYASGGLIDYTGIAKVDGTPSKPELVLNARDTENFMAFRDVLRTTPYLSALSSKQYVGGANVLGGGGTTIEEVNVTIPIERVVDYNDLVTQMQRDPKFERMLRAMTTDVAVGGSELRKNRFQF